MPLQIELVRPVLVGICAIARTAGLVFEDDGAQAAEFVTVSVAEFGEPGGRLSFEFGLDCLQQLESLGGDVGDSLPLIIASAGASNESAVLQAVHEPGDIGSAFHHALGNLAARMPLGMHPAKDS